ncbi:teichuronic acid biosynthesis [Nautilia profundicola AmH]|uniref:Teichuronic acid biosynthesis n=1 Tax=Nautilia profundicola (strain ATCC BAA-1463 / DSM 18972 / AmH) TaxID=598659 RepID=B9L6P7_NAUPA|nr:glycosyltransferase family 2 protein [Nautilia profundicola]ACM93540.1 teichuronic acid biosynthesis [Nautilia profundicola AmH]
MHDLVSIITPSYNSEKFISKTIVSVLNQTYRNLEMIIVDDCSPDNSNEIIEEYIKKDKRIKLIKLDKNSGPAVARNTAIKEAKGRYIAFLDADDLWIPEKLERQINFMKENDLSFTYSAYDLIDENDNNIGDFIPPKEIDYKSLLKTNPIGCLTAIYDAKKLGKIYMPNILKRQDYGLWLKILKQIESTKGMQEKLAIYRIRKNSVSSNKLKAAKYQWKIYREVEKLNIFQSIYYFLNYAYYGLKKY